MFLRPAGSEEVAVIIRKLKNKATSDTKISALKLAGEIPGFVKAIAETVSLSFEQGVFPQSLKLARVIPIYKGGTKTEVSNYRPISLLSSFSKIYEKLMHFRITEFMESNNISTNRNMDLGQEDPASMLCSTHRTCCLIRLTEDKSVYFSLLIFLRLLTW